MIGNSGVGKSTLINAVLGEEKAETGWGTKGTTDHLEIYESDEIPFRIIDSVGFEPSLIKKIQAVNAVKKWSKESTKKGNKDSQINVIWFCVDGTAGKLFLETIKNLSSATSMWESVPVIVAIMKSYSVPDRKKDLAQSIVGVSTTAGVVVGAVPVPFADALILSPIEVAEINALAQVYGISKNEDSKQFFDSIVEVGTVSAAAKAVISGLKAIPGVNLAAGIVNAIIAGSFVAAIGEGTIYAFEQVYLGKKTVEDIDWVKKVIESKLSTEFIEKVTLATKQITENTDKKAIGKIILALFTAKNK